MEEEVGGEVVDGEEVVDSHARPQRCSEQEFAVRRPLVMCRGEGLCTSELGERYSVPDVEVSRQLSKTSAHQYASLWTPNQLISRLGAQVSQCLAFAIVERGLGGILAIRHRKVIALRIPLHIVNRALLIRHHIRLALAIGRKIVEVRIAVVVVRTGLIALRRRQHQQRLTSIVPMELHIIAIEEGFAADGLAGRHGGEERDAAQFGGRSGSGGGLATGGQGG